MKTYRMNGLGPCSAFVRRSIPALLLIPALAWTSEVLGAPITFNTALPVPEGVFIAREQLIVNQSGDDPSGAGRDRTEVTAVSVLGYGLTGRWALFGVLPYRDIDLDVTSGAGRVTRRAEGFGDLRVFARYTAYRHDRPQRTTRVAPFFGVGAPTGEDTERDVLGVVPPAVQPGSGGWDVFGGVAATYQTLRYQVDGQVAFQANEEANGFEAGDLVRLDGSLQYRLYPKQFAGGVPGFLHGVIEVNLIHQGRNRINGITDPNSGGTRLFLTPGIQYIGQRWAVEGAVQVPVVQDLNGTALENDYILRAGFRFLF